MIAAVDASSILGGLAAIVATLAAYLSSRRQNANAAVKEARNALFIELRYWQREVVKARRAERVCQLRLGIIENLLRQHGITVPPLPPIEVLPDELDFPAIEP